MKKNIAILLLPLLIAACKPGVSEQDHKELLNITKGAVKEVVKSIVARDGVGIEEDAQRGVAHVASLWRNSDGSEADFKAFCLEEFIADKALKNEVFERVSRNVEILYGHFNKVSLDLQRPLHEPMGPIFSIDKGFGGYDVSAHLIEDLYRNKLAFSIALNFPYFSLDEKEKLGVSWTRQQWAFARLGDLFVSRIPSNIIQDAAEVASSSEMYIADYNIYMGNLTDGSNSRFFPKEMVLLTHWNLRDEIKSNYPKGGQGLINQAMIYEVMKRIINQTIPQSVINNGSCTWDPYTNVVYQDGSPVETSPEGNERYQHILNNFHAMRAMDDYSTLNNAIMRAFEGQMEITQENAEKLFIKFLSSSEVKDVAQLIKERLGRDLKPWDIWYDGFKSRSGVDEESLNAITRQRYPDAKAFKADLPNMLSKLGFSDVKSAFLAERIAVDPARGSGHAWGAAMRGEQAHLRTRIGNDGMDYKGYNIAVHEFGHNVEQTISLYDMDYYFLNGVPNTAFTEALAFIFQKRDLELLGINTENVQADALNVLDDFWSTYEIMGVSLVDQRTWKWMYQHPNATSDELNKAVESIAKEVWNSFYEPVFGSVDEPVLAIYSHMINSPLYLSNYAFGHLIQFQVEQYLKSANFAPEVERLYRIGRLTPNAWMKEALNEEISIKPLLKEAGKAVKLVRQS